MYPTENEIAVIKGYLLSGASIFQIHQLTGVKESIILEIRDELVAQGKLGND